MEKRDFSPTLRALIIALLAVAGSVYLHHKKSDKLAALNESKSQLTSTNIYNQKRNLKTIIQKNLNLPQNNAISHDQDILLKERIFTESEIKKMSEDDFISLLKDTQRRLPKMQDLKILPKTALHFTPPIVLQAGRELGLIKEILHMHENYESLTFSFYQNCAKDKEGITPIRALCLTNLIELSKKSGQKLNLVDYPQNLIELSRIVTGIE